ncbi:hypothetical protein CCUS01_04810 [Colletotrichum cuscutae]|uniref:Uncharacterized protein n=1 Tax=Colletotrichum cuscutae TaxID=1209917 RepID=A0AAI9Y3K6_9PEZI|nr:hypothetical protein CCUS01_04810 [Colletotrichum cuscutae]
MGFETPHHRVGLPRRLDHHLEMDSVHRNRRVQVYGCCCCDYTMQ